MPTEPTKAEPPKRKRRWFQFSLRTLMIVVTLLAMVCGYVGWQYEIVRARKLFAEAQRDFVTDTSGQVEIPWIRKLLGDEGIWQNDQRNAAIVSIANALRTAKLTRLAKYGFPPDVIRRWTAVLKRIIEQIMPQPLVQLAVVVELAEHARQLRALFDHDAKLASTAEEKDEELWNSWFDVPIVIITAAEARKAGLPKVVVRCDGTGTSMHELVGRWPDEPWKGPLLVVDLDDTFDDHAKRDTFRRRSDYLDQGYSPEQTHRQIAHRNRRAQ